MSSSSGTLNSLLGKKTVPIPDAIGLHGNSNVKFVDGSWWLGKDRSGRQDFETGPRIADARFLDIDDIATKTPDNLPHMMPSSYLHSAAMDAMGIGNSDHVVVYGAKDCFFISRAYIQMRTMGHPQEFLHLLDGSLQDWIDAGGPIEAEGTAPNYPVLDAETLLEKTKLQTIYDATDPQNVVDLEELKTLITEGKTADENPAVLIVDARSKERFLGEVEEPRPNLRLGHMPGAKNLFFMDLVDADNKVRFKSKEQLRQIIQEAGITLPLSPDTKIISSCGSGVTACSLLAALDILGEDSSQVYLYDGAWIQWGSQSDTPIVKDWYFFLKNTIRSVSASRQLWFVIKVTF